MADADGFANLVEMFFAHAASRGDRPFLWHKAGGAWCPRSWGETARDVARLRRR